MDSGELEYAIKSILKYAPYIKNIYIVHCQTRQIEELLTKIIPQASTTMIKTVHHSIILETMKNFCQLSIVSL